MVVSILLGCGVLGYDMGWGPDETFGLDVKGYITGIEVEH